MNENKTENMNNEKMNNEEKTAPEKRKWDEQKDDDSSQSKKMKTNDEENDEESLSNENKAPKRKVALIIGYDGSGYSGLQTNPSVTTIEDTLLQAIVKAGGISEMNAEFKKVAWSRSSRTDKGVHAVVNVICLKLILLPDIIERIDKELEQIVKQKNLSPIIVYDYLRVTTSFDAKNSCDSRKYCYVLPTYAFEHIDKLTELQATKTNGYVKLEEQMSSITIEELVKSKSYIEAYRVSAERLQKARELFSKYVGTKCYHNFTQKAKTSAASSVRYVMDFKVGEPFVNEELGGIEHVILTVKGQSFVLNQIRKMIGFVVAIMRGHIPESDFDIVFEKNKSYFVPMAPGTGLLLDKLYFKSYNQKHGKVHGEFDCNREDLKPKLHAFKQVIINNIVKREKEELIMARWLYVLPRTCYPELRPLARPAAESKKSNQKQSYENKNQRTKNQNKIESKSSADTALLTQSQEQSSNNRN
jgi:tRNA pseudouridine38-40 synthase